MIDRLFRASLFLLAATIFCTLAHGRALAVTEYCPAIVGDMSPWKPGGAGAFTYDLIGFAQRELAGTVTVQSDSGWYTFAFKDARTVKRSMRTWALGADSITFTDFSSDALYVVFPKPLKIVRAWVSDATIRWDESGAWTAGQHVSCGPLASDGDDFMKWSLASVEMQPERVVAATRDGIAISSASPMPEPKGLNCPKPFVDAKGHGNDPGPTVAELEQRGEPHVVLVALAVNALGTLDDAWIYASSGIPGLDAAALKAARSAEYTHGTALCKPAPTEALFRAEF